MASRFSDDSTRHILSIVVDKEVIPDQGKQPVYDGISLEAHSVDGQPVSVNSSDSESGHPVKPTRRKFRWSRKRIFIIAIVLVLVAVGAIVGGVWGAKHLAASQSPPPFSNRSIAAVSFDGDANSRVYFLNDESEIVESARGDQDNNWIITKTGFVAKKGSRLAAAASRPGQPEEITILFLDINNTIHGIVSDVTGWREGNLASQKLNASSDSALTVMYDWCARCANTTLFAFQDDAKFVHLGNLTADGLEVTSLDPGLDAHMNGSLALQPFFRQGESDQINLWSQKARTGELEMSHWDAEDVNNGQNGWNFNNFTFFKKPNHSAQIAAASSYTNISNTGYETWIQVLTTGPTGINVNTWSGAKNGFIANQSQPAAMQYSDNKSQTYGSLAITAQGDAYAVSSQTGLPDTIVSWQVADDLTTWKSMGIVDIGHEWG